MDIRYATPEDDLRRLWRVCFQHEDEGYFREDYRPENTLIAADESGAPAAMLHMLPRTLRIPAHPASGQSGREISVMYVMGVGTSPEFRGQGLAGDLVEQLLFELHLRGISLALLLPCGARMAEFYARYGFRQLGMMPKAVEASADGERVLTGVTDADAAELNALYERLCGGTAHLRRDTAYWTQIADEYELRVGDGRYRVLYEGTILEDSAAELGKSDVCACVKVIEADVVRMLMEGLGYPSLPEDFRDSRCPWNGRSGSAPEELLAGIPFYVNLLYNERVE